MTEQEFVTLLKGFLEQTLTSNELELFFQESARPEFRNLLGEAVLHDLEKKSFASITNEAPKQKVWQQLESEILKIKDTAENQSKVFAQVHRVHFLKNVWFRYAAAVIFLFSTAAYFYISNKNIDQPTSASANKNLPNDIAPGGNRAILTLADGTQIILDQASNGSLAQQGNAQIVKQSNGQIVYSLQGKSNNELLLNTMSTPIGGQYQLTLPDGTKVWLNASSSITFPTEFIGKNRSVKISGEAYFEVTRNKQKPFIVDVEGKSLVEVLGTSFNVNSYNDEEVIKTTLIEGSVKISKNNAYSAILKPGEQAQVTKGVKVVSNIDITQTLAWKDGLFNFEGLNLQAVMRQLERWYGIKVQYKKPNTDLIFHGKMYRNVNLSYVLEMLKRMGVEFELQGNNLLII